MPQTCRPPDGARPSNTAPKAIKPRPAVMSRGEADIVEHGELSARPSLPSAPEATRLHSNTLRTGIPAAAAAAGYSPTPRNHRPRGVWYSKYQMAKTKKAVSQDRMEWPESRPARSGQCQESRKKAQVNGWNRLGGKVDGGALVAARGQGERKYRAACRKDIDRETNENDVGLQPQMEQSNHSAQECARQIASQHTDIPWTVNRHDHRRQAADQHHAFKRHIERAGQIRNQPAQRGEQAAASRFGSP